MGIIDSFAKASGYVTLAQYSNLFTLGGQSYTELKHNLVTIEGTKLLAGALSGLTSYRVTGVYFHFSNAASPVIPVIDRLSTALDIQSVSGDEDYLYAPLSASAAIGSGDSTGSGNTYTGNRATFFAMATGSVGSNGLPFTAAAGSNVISLGLVARIDEGDITKDILYARYTPVSPFAKEAGRSPGVTWTAEFV